MAAQYAFAVSSTSEKSVIAQVLVVSSLTITLPAYSNVKLEVNQIAPLQLCTCMNLPILYYCKNEENWCYRWLISSDFVW